MTHRPLSGATATAASPLYIAAQIYLTQHARPSCSRCIFTTCSVTFTPKPSTPNFRLVASAGRYFGVTTFDRPLTGNLTVNACD